MTMVTKPQWCELCCQSHADTQALRRRVEGQQVTERLMVCQGCIRVLRAAGWLRPSQWGKHECWEVDVALRVPAPTYAFAAMMTSEEATLLRVEGYRVAKYKE